MPIRIITVGKKHESWVAEGIERYQQRLKRPFLIEWVILPHSSQSGSRACQDESQRIINRLDTSEYVILMDEAGENINSVNLSKLLLQSIETAQKVVIIIGGAYGVDDSVKQRADFVWSLSKLVFPHQLVRLILTEQLYRAQEIASDNPYHHI